MTSRIALVALLGALTLPSAALGSIFTGTGYATSAPQLAGGTTIDFNSATSGVFATQTINGVTFTGVDAPFTIGPDFDNQYNNHGGKSLFNDFDYVPLKFRFDFAGAVSAFGFNWGAADFNWTLNAYDSANNLLDTTTVLPTFASNAGDYVGVVAANIAYATLEGLSGDYVFIDDFTYVRGGAPNGVVPEPLSVAVWGCLALVGGWGAYVRRRA